jgi:hypothetical protein
MLHAQLGAEGLLNDEVQAKHHRIGDHPLKLAGSVDNLWF